MKKNLKSKILKAATRMFAKKGYIETNLGHIATAAGISKGGIYHYYLKKEDILFDALNGFVDLLVGDLESELKELKDHDARMQFIISRHIRIALENTLEAKALVRHSYCLSARKFKRIAEKERGYYRIVADAISEFLGGEIPKEKLTAMTFALFGMCNWMYIWYDPKKPLTPDDLGRIFKAIFMHGVSEAMK